MHLRCKYCEAVQPVTVADEVDDDPRMQGIRQTFRAIHRARCGADGVSLELESIEATHVDPAVWTTYLAHINPPPDVQLGGDGFFSRNVRRDGVLHTVRVCEDCWQTIPRYVDFPQGLISPESDGDAAPVPKLQADTVPTDSPKRAAAARHLWKAVCLPCYHAAFARVYPDARETPLNAAVIGDQVPLTALELPPPPAEVLGKVTMTRWDVEAP